MNNSLKLTLITSLLSLPAAALAGTPAPASTPLAVDVCSHCSHNDAPIGVMFDHLHTAGDWMLGYRYFYSDFGGLQKNGDSISNRDAFDQGFTSVPVDMDMHMHMLEIMYSPTDWLTLMVMPMYMDMSMTMQPGGDAHGHGGHGGHDSHGHGGGTFEHNTSGWGDTNVSALFPLLNREHHKIHGALGLYIPTGSVDEKIGGRFTHYMMQLGSGTWDLNPSLTYRGHAGRFFWGGQYLGIIRLEDENDSGYRLGNVHQGTAWTGVEVCDWLNFTGRAAYRHEGDLRGHYNGPHNHCSPPDLTVNYGGDSFDLGIGMNVFIPRGALKGNRFSVEALWPVWQDLRGVQIEREFTLVAGWQWTF